MWLDFYFDDRYYAELMHESGVLSSQLLVVTLVMSPLKAWVARGSSGLKQKLVPIIRWALGRRRDFGVAAFGYAILHTIFYIRANTGLDHILLEAMEIELLVGWVAFFIFLALGITSNNWSVKRLGSRWKGLHRWTYLSAVATFLHWYWLDFFLWQVLLWFVPVLILQVIRVSIRYRSR